MKRMMMMVALTAACGANETESKFDATCPSEEAYARYAETDEEQCLRDCDTMRELQESCDEVFERYEACSADCRVSGPSYKARLRAQCSTETTPEAFCTGAGFTSAPGPASDNSCGTEGCAEFLACLRQFDEAQPQCF